MSKFLTTKVFRKAAKLIENRGFCQGYLRGEDGSLCVMGAVLTALGRSTDNAWTKEEEFLPEMQMLAGTLPGNWSCLQRWNDKKGRTKKQAVQFLLEADKEWDREPWTP